MPRIPDAKVKCHGVGIAVVKDFTIEQVSVVAAQVKEKDDYVEETLLDYTPYKFCARIFLHCDPPAVHVEIARIDDTEGAVNAHYSYELLTEDFKQVPGEMVRNEGMYSFSPEGVYGDSFPSLADLSRLGILSDNTLRIRVAIKPEFPGVASLETSPPRTGSSDYAQHMASLLSTGKFSDISVFAGNAEFRVHRSILASRSTVFDSLLHSNMSESTSGKITIPDVDSATMSDILRFLYTGSLEGGLIDKAEKILDSNDDCSILGEWHYIGPGMGHFMIKQETENLAFAGSIGVRAKEMRQVTGRLVEATAGEWVLDLHDSPGAGGSTGHRSLTLSLKEGDLWIKYPEHEYFYNLCAFSKQRLDMQQELIQSWCRIMRAADKYNITELIDVCEVKLIDLIDFRTVVPVLMIAAELQRESFKDIVLKHATVDEDTLRAVVDTREFDSLNRDLALEIMQMFAMPPRKRARSDAGSREFADDDDWSRLSCAQLRRACVERGLSSSGSRKDFIDLLHANTGSGHQQLSGDV